MEGVSILRFFFAFGTVLALIALGAWLLKRYAHRLTLPGAYNQSAGKRLSVVEMQAVGPRQRLVLVKRDHVEHLLLIGDGAPVVVERGIEHGK